MNIFDKLNDLYYTVKFSLEDAFYNVKDKLFPVKDEETSFHDEYVEEEKPKKKKKKKKKKNS